MLVSAHDLPNLTFQGVQNRALVICNRHGVDENHLRIHRGSDRAGQIDPLPGTLQIFLDVDRLTEAVKLGKGRAMSQRQLKDNAVGTE
jgi:hypothetical protein